MKKILLIYVIVISITIALGNILTACRNGSSSSNSNPTTSPQLNAILNNYLQQYGESQYFSAMSATVQCGNNTPINGVTGTYQLSESSGSITPDSLFQIGSITKSFTSVVILQLAADPNNNLSLQDTVSKWFRYLNGTPMYPQWESITLEELMNMTSGIEDYTNDPIIVVDYLANPSQYFNPLKLITMMESIPVSFAPGMGWSYSNTNYVLLGELIQNITGNSPMIEIQNRIINKLHLTHTYFPSNLPAQIIPTNQMVNGYAYFESQDLPPGYESFENTLFNTTWSSVSLFYTAGAIISTPADLITYIHALYNPNGGLLNQNQIKMLNSFVDAAYKSPTAGQPITLSESHPLGYGLGVIGNYNYPKSTGITYFYNGATLGYSSFWFYNPKLNLYISYSMNARENQSFLTLYPKLFEYAVSTECRESIPFISPFSK